MIVNDVHASLPPIRSSRLSLIGIPSPQDIRLNRLSGVRIGGNHGIGSHCIVFGNTFIGDRFRCGDQVLIREQSSIGDDVSLGNGCVVGPGVSIESGTSVGQEVQIPGSATIGARVVIGSRVCFLEHFPESGSGPHTILRDDCVIGAAAVIAPGVCIGENAQVAEGCIVTRDVPPNVCASGDPVTFRNREA